MRDRTYPVGHPVAIAFAALQASIVNGEAEVNLDRVNQAADDCGISFGSEIFDQAAAMIGLPYSPTWDLYVPSKLWAEIELPAPHPRVHPLVQAEVVGQIQQDPLM